MSSRPYRIVPLVSGILAFFSLATILQGCRSQQQSSSKPPSAPKSIYDKPVSELSYAEQLLMVDVADESELPKYQASLDKIRALFPKSSEEEIASLTAFAQDKCKKKGRNISIMRLMSGLLESSALKKSLNAKGISSLPFEKALGYSTLEILKQLDERAGG